MSRILFLDQFGEIGGGQTVLLSLVKAAVQTGMDVSVLAPGGGGLEAEIRSRFGDDVGFMACEEPALSHGRKRFRDLFAHIAYGRRFRRHRTLLAEQDVIYVNGMRHLPHLLFLPGLKARLIYHVHIDHSALEKALLRLAAAQRRTFRIVANSRFIIERLALNGEKCVLVENALDPVFARRAFVDRFHAAGRWVSAVVGSLRSEKGQDIAVEVVAARKDMDLYLIGRDGYGAKDWIDAVQRRATACIHFNGPTGTVSDKLDSLGVQFNLVPSRWEEPFGLVAIEGMACSCLTIVSGRGGLAEIAEITGAVVAPDKSALAEALEWLCALPRQALSDMARQQFEATQRHYAPERFESAMAALLRAAAA